MEFYRSVGLKVYRLRVVCREQLEGGVKRDGVASVGKRELWQIVRMDLRFVRPLK